MAQPRTSARLRTQARQQRQRERTVALAAVLSVTAVLVSAFLIFFTLLNWPGTALRNFWLLNVVNGQVNPGSVLYQQLLAEIEPQEALFITPACLVVGGLVLGRLTPRRISRTRLLQTAGVITVGVVFSCLLVRWGLILFGQNWHLRAGEVDTRLTLIQTACSIGWILAYLIGTWAGVLWRDSRSKEGIESGEAVPDTALS